MANKWLDTLLNSIDNIEISIGDVDNVQESLLEQIRSGLLGFEVDDTDFAPMVADLMGLLDRAKTLAAQENQKESDAGAELTSILRSLAVWSALYAQDDEDKSKSLEYLKRPGGMAVHAATYNSQPGAEAKNTTKGTVNVPFEAEPRGESVTSPAGLIKSPKAGQESQDTNDPDTSMSGVHPLEIQAEARSIKWGIPVLQDGLLGQPPVEFDDMDVEYGDPVNFKYPMYDKPSSTKAMRDFAADVKAKRYQGGRSIILDRIRDGQRRWAAPIDPDSETSILITSDTAVSQEKAEELGLEQLDSKFESRIEILADANYTGESQALLQAAKELPKGTIAKVRAPLTFGNSINSEGHVYQSSLWQAQVPRLKGLAQNNRLLGNLDHPADGKSRLCDAAIRWMDQSIYYDTDKDALYAEGYVMNTTAGRDVAALIENDVPVEISSRGYGRLKPGEFQGQEVKFVDSDTFVCTAFDVVWQGASSKGSMRPKLELAQDSSEPVLSPEVYGLDKLKTLRERFERLQGRARVDEFLERLETLANSDEVTEEDVTKLEEAAGILETAYLVSEEEADEDEQEQAYVDARVAISPSGTVSLVMPREALMRASDGKNTFGNAPANDEPTEKPNIRKGVWMPGATHPVDASEAQAGSRMARYQEEDPRMVALNLEILKTKTKEALAQEKNPRKRTYISKRLESVHDFQEFDTALNQASSDYDEMFGEMDAVSSSAPAENLEQWGMPYFQVNHKNPADEPAKTDDEAIDKLVQSVDSDFLPLNQFVPVGEKNEYRNVPDDSVLPPGHPVGQKSPKHMLKGYLKQFCAPNSPGSMLLQYHKNLEWAHWMQSKTAHDQITQEMGNNPVMGRLLAQALGTGGMSTSQVAAGQAHLLKIITATWPKLIAPYVGAIQPTNKPSATVYYERFKGTSDTDPPTELESAADGGSTPLIRFDIESYRKWTNGVYSEDPGEGTDASVVQYSIDSDTVSITAKKLRAEWSLESEQDLLSYHALDTASQYVSFMSDEIARQINDEILDAAIAAAPSAHTVNFSAIQPSGYGNQALWDSKILTALTKAGTEVYKDRQALPNIVVAAPNIVQRLAQVGKERSGMQYNGFSQQLVEGLAPMDYKIDNYVVFNYARWANITAYKNAALLIYRGVNWSSVGIVWVPYTFEITPLDTTASSFKRQIGCMDRSGYKIVEPNCLGKLTVDGEVASSADIIGVS